MKVAILHERLPPEARPDELDVLVQAKAVAEALTRLGHQPVFADFSLDLAGVMESLRDLHPDLVFNLVESAGGQGRLVYLAPATLDALGLPYTGARTEAMFLTSNKLVTKRILQLHHLPTPSWFCSRMAGDNGRPVNGRYIIKSVWEEASVGLDESSVVRAGDLRALQEEIHRRTDALGGEAFAEAFIDGREFNLSLLSDADGPQVLPPAETRFVDYGPDKPKIVGYRAKWEEESFEYRHTLRRFDFADSDRPLLSELTSLARLCWQALGLDGYARVDFRVDQTDRPWVLEVNANPCLSPDAGFMAAAERAGLSYEDVVQRLLAHAVHGMARSRAG